MAAAWTAEPLRFAVIGDYGFPGVPEAQVANMVKGWKPAFIVTVGDNNYYEGDYRRFGTLLYDGTVGAYYGQFIKYPRGSASRYAPGPAVNRFFPALGNHDVGKDAIPPAYGFPCWAAYFDLPGNERYYDFVQGSVHFFVLDSDDREPDGITAAYADPQPSAQALWLKTALKNSTAPWKFVILHHPPFGSDNASHGRLRWPFREWGAQAVFAGHNHVYERLSLNGIPYTVNGLGGQEMYPLYNIPTLGSVIRANANHGAMLVEVADTVATLKFFYMNGTLLDEAQISRTPIANVVDRPVAAANDDAVEDGAGKVRLSEWIFRLGAPGDSLAGMRFQAVNIPPKATITTAYLQLKARGAFNEKAEYPTYNQPMTLLIQGELPGGGAAAFNAAANNISRRVRTKAAVAWTPPEWGRYEEGPAQRTADFRTVVQEMVNSPEWAGGQPLVLILSRSPQSGPGVRNAYTWEANVINSDTAASGAPLLHVQWIGPYELRDLGTLNWGSYAYAFGINALGEVTGYSDSFVGRAVDRAFLWSSSGMTELRTPWSTADKTYGFAISDSRAIVGNADRSGSGAFVRAIRWTPTGGLVVLGTLGGTSAALAVNNQATAVGYSKNAAGVERAVRWGSDGKTVDLGSLAGAAPAYASCAYGINNSGYVVGKAVTPTNGLFHAFCAKPDSAIQPTDDLGALGGPGSVANAINDLGMIVGSAQTRDLKWHAFFKSGYNSPLVDLGALGGSNSDAQAVNSSGIVVGKADKPAGSTAFIWQPGWPGPLDLNSLRPPGSTLTLLAAEAINDNGDIVGYARDAKGAMRAFLLTALR